MKTNELSKGNICKISEKYITDLGWYWANHTKNYNS